LKRRSMKAARAAMAKKLTKGIPKAELTPARKQEIEKRLDKMQPRINRLAKKMLPKIRQAELGKKRG
jgi:tetrahydromethanopterin S-methyltransferase subunit G